MIFNTFPNPSRTTIPPSNYKRGKTARDYVEYYADSHRLRAQEAIFVQGSDLVIWNRQLSNRYCTCQGLSSVINNNPAVLENTRPEVLLAESTESVREASSGKQQLFTRTRNAERASLQTTLSSSDLGSLKSLVDTLYDSPIVVKEVKKQNSLLEEAFIEQKKNLGVEYSDYVNCPICFGTRHTDSYQPYKGTRILLDGSDFYPLTLSGVTLVRSDKPYTFSFNAGSSYIIWTVKLPKYFKAQSIKVFNLEHQSSSFKLSFAEVGSNIFTALNLSSLQNRSGSSNELQIKCEVSLTNITLNQEELLLRMSHIEFVLLYSDVYEKGELPMLTIPEQIDYQELYLRTKIILNPKIDNISRNDLIAESKYGLLWQVVDLDKVYTDGGKLTQLEADLRLIQNSEKLYNLAVFPRKMSSWQTNLHVTTSS